MSTKLQSYRVNGPNSGDYPVGTICYDSKGWDYGLASDDTRMTGHKHVSVTLSPDGEYPTFTIRESFLEKLP